MGGGINGVPVIWVFGNRGDRCHGMVEDALAGELYPTGMTFTHHMDLNSAGTEGRRHRKNYTGCG